MEWNQKSYELGLLDGAFEVLGLYNIFDVTQKDDKTIITPKTEVCISNGWLEKIGAMLTNHFGDCGLWLQPDGTIEVK